MIPVGTTYAPYGPGGPFVTYTVIESRSYRREYSREEAYAGYGYEGGYSYERGGGGGGYRYEERGGYEGGYDRGCDCYREREADYPPPPPPPPPPPAHYEPQQDPYYFPSEPDSCYRGGSGECG